MSGEYDEISDDAYDELEEFDEENEGDEQEYEPLDETEELDSEIENEYEPRDENQELNEPFENEFYPLDENEELRSELNQYQNEHLEKSLNRELNDNGKQDSIKEIPEFKEPISEKPKSNPYFLDHPDGHKPPLRPLPEKIRPSNKPSRRPQRQPRPSLIKKLKEYFRSLFKRSKKPHFTKTTEQLRDELTVQQYKSIKYKKNKN